MRPFVVAGNWKMNHGPREARAFMERFSAEWKKDYSCEVVFFPPAVSWREVKEGCHQANCHWGLQNIYHQDAGAFTGEVAAAMAREIGAGYALVGHSERRQIFSETDEDCSLKVAAVQKHGMVPVLCLGETLEEREQGRTEEVILRQLESGFSRADWSKKLMIAYEPVWAIGTGRVATTDQAQEAHSLLRTKLQEMAGKEVASRTAILYGGSVKPENAGQLSKQSDIDGFLVGGASLKADSFLQIVRNSVYS